VGNYAWFGEPRRCLPRSIAGGFIRNFKHLLTVISFPTELKKIGYNPKKYKKINIFMVVTLEK
jgi:hypothetical protein